jgi:hypothetical protein
LRSKKSNNNPTNNAAKIKNVVEAKKTSDTTPKKVPEKNNSETLAKELLNLHQEQLKEKLHP